MPKREKRERRLTRKALILALKIGIGTSVAMYIATVLGLQNAGSAGIITLLTIVTTKWETLRLSWARLVTFVAAVGFSVILFQMPISPWIMFGLYIFIFVLIGEYMDWKSTLSVNAVIGTHFLTTRDFSLDFIINEFQMLIIGIVVAIILNVLRKNKSHRDSIVDNMRTIETELREILAEMAGYVRGELACKEVWHELEELERKIQHYIVDAYEYEGNTIRVCADYYIAYFEMRLNQCMEFYSLHTELKRMQSMPAEAEAVANYMLYLREYVVEHNYPEEQMKRLRVMMDELRAHPLPKTREEFESSAIIYHVLSQLEAFIEHKLEFVDGLDEEQISKYWGMTS